MTNLLVPFDFLSERDVEAFNETLAATIAEPNKHFFLLVRKANRLLVLIWDNVIEEKFFYKGKLFEFTPEQRQIVIAMARQKPTVESFNRFCLVVNSCFEHPIKDSIKELIRQLTPLVLAVHDLSPKKAYDNASLRTDKPGSL